MTDALDASEPPKDVGESGVAVARRLLEGVSTHAIFMLDADGNVAAWPAPAATLYGYETTAVLDRHVRTLFADDEGAGDSDSLPEDFFDEPMDEPVEFEHRHRRADGSVFWATLTLSPLRDDGFHGYAAVCRDTTTTKEYERMLERRNNRLKEFTDILAHDLRNPLNVIEGNLTLYEETGDEEYLDTVDETVDRMARLVDDLLRVARQGNVVSDPEPTDIGEVVETVWRSIGEDSGATLTYEPVPSVSSDPDRLRELFENLFQNAADHGGDDAAVRVGPLDDGFYVEDDGPGIADGRETEVFDHGFTTSADGHGYGLSVVRAVVDAHGWEIVATGADNGGARFEVTGIDFLG